MANQHSHQDRDRDRDPNREHDREHDQNHEPEHDRDQDREHGRDPGRNRDRDQNADQNADQDSDQDSDQTIRIVTWPEGNAVLRHAGDAEQPVRLRVAMLDDPPVDVRLSTVEPVGVGMATAVVVPDPITLSIAVDEPICANSDYRVGVDLFDQDIATIAVRGQTRVQRCADRPQPVEVCQRFDLATGAEGAPVIRAGEVRLRALGGGVLRTTTDPPPENTTTVLFPDEGVRIDLPGPAHDVRLTVRNFGAELTLRVLGDTGEIATYTEQVVNDVRVLAVPHAEVTAVEVRGGSNEAGVAEICYTPDRIG